MSPLAADDERRLAQIVLQAAALDTGERTAFLRAAGGDNPAILEEARRRLASAAGLESAFLAQPLGQLFASASQVAEPVPALPPGTVIGPYRLLRLLGRGGMGEVYEAHDETRDRSIAIKHIRPETTGDPIRRERFWREARVLAELGHPAIVRILDFLEVDASEWIVMELVAGPTLAELLRDGPLDLDLAIDVGRQIASALAAAHSRGIVHRDLKTENVMVTGEQVKVLDFGLARRFHSATRAAKDAEGKDTRTLSTAGQVLGTPRSMSPEQARGRPVDAQSDLFSLGVLLYEALTAHSPFSAGSLYATLDRIMTHHPPPVRRLNPEIPRPISDLVTQLLEKDPARRGDGAEEVVRALANGSPHSTPPTEAKTPARPAAQHSANLRVWPAPKLPELPYPVLLPYAHPALLAGRDREVGELRDRLRMRLPVLGLYGASGVGKSSLLLGGLVPALRAEGRPVALVRHPGETGVAQRLAADLLVEDTRVPTEPLSDDDRNGFLERLREVQRLAAQPAILVIDQFEDVMRSRLGASSTIGGLLAATVSNNDSPAPCRWLLSYRQELHGAVEVWLRDLLQDRRAAYFHSLPLPPLATATGSVSGEVSIEDATRTFLEAIEKPLTLRQEDGTRRYSIRFAPGHAECLARAFAQVRLDLPDAPLVPELQVVLAHLLAQAKPSRSQHAPPTVIELSDSPGPLIDKALDDHLRRALKSAFAKSSDGRAEMRTRRARAVLALYELATASGQRRSDRQCAIGMSSEALTRAIGKDGEEILEQLATPLTRLVVPLDHGNGLHYVLSHESMAGAIMRMVDEDGFRDELFLDTELLALRRFVALETALHRSRKSQATRIPRRHFHRISANARALLGDEQRRAWFAACRRQRKDDRRRLVIFAALAMLALAVVGWGAWTRAHRLAENRALLGQVAEGEPEVAIRALDRIATEASTTDRQLLALLRQREIPMDILERGLGALDGSDRSTAVLRVVEIALPWVEQMPLSRSPEYQTLIANLTWALDYAPSRDPRFADRARALRDRVLEPLRRLHPPPSPTEHSAQDWIQVPAGSFTMGTAPQEPGNDDERPERVVTISAFQLMRHEVTNQEYRLLVPDHRGDGDLPAGFVSWYAAYTYAAWLGGRLPTEAEWEYAARAGCPHAYCTGDGKETTVDAVAWTLRSSRDAITGKLVPRPGRRLEPNPWGFYDMLGNLWEWTADWYGEYSPDDQHDPWGPASSDGAWRADRGGCYWLVATRTRPAFRFTNAPSDNGDDQGFRVAIPGSLER